MKLNELTTEKPNRVRVLLKAVKQQETKAGKPYVVLTVCDGENEDQAKLWDTTEESLSIKIGEVFDAVMAKDDYGLTIKQPEPIDQAEVDISEFIPTAPMDLELLYVAIMEMIATIENEFLRKLVEIIYVHAKQLIMYASAAKMLHHNILGGLMWHQYRMAKMAEQTAAVYGKEVNRDLIIVGSLLHDIGKLQEMETDTFGNAEYTKKGFLFGHLYLGSRIVEQYARSLKDVAIDQELLENLLHIIVSHHGKQEYGAIVAPQTMEAYVVSELDMMDSKMYQYTQAEKNVPDGEFTKDRIFGLGVKVYKPMCRTILAEAEDADSHDIDNDG